jgi:hypothetical protein
MKVLVVSFSFLFSFLATNAQTLPLADSTKRVQVSPSKRAFESACLISVPMITLGFIASHNEFIVNKYEIKEERDEKFGSFHSHADDYLQYAPIAAVYSLAALGIKGKNNIRTASILLLKSELLMNIIVKPLKSITHVQRPDGSGYSSFPSGHTAQAFVGAEFLRREYGDAHPWVAVGGYVTAATVGALRMLNNKHWLPDIFAGAGIGILSVNVVYFTQHKKGANKKLLAVPTYSAHQPGIFLSYSL